MRGGVGLRRGQERRQGSPCKAGRARQDAIATFFQTTTMDALNPDIRDSPSQIPASHVKYHLPYFTPAEVEQLSDKQRGKLSVTQEEKARQQACGFIEAVGAKIGLYVPVQS